MIGQNWEFIDVIYVTLTGGQPGTSMIMTQPGNLKCKKILHLHGQTQPQMIQKFVGDAILMCIQNNMKSVSFPALGTGVLKSC